MKPRSRKYFLKQTLLSVNDYSKRILKVTYYPWQNKVIIKVPSISDIYTVELKSLKKIGLIQQKREIVKIHE